MMMMMIAKGKRDIGK